MSMITASLWVPRGAAKEFPTKCDIDEDELARISKLAKLQLTDAQADLEEAKVVNGSTKTGSVAKRSNSGSSEEGSDHEDDGDSDTDMNGGVQRSKTEADDDLTAYDLEHYDDDEEAEAGDPVSMFGNARSLAFHQSNEDDPYLVGTKAELDEEEEEEKEELRVLPTDNMVVAAKVEDEVPYLEVYVYEDEADNLYVHHDVMLPAIPLAIEWMDLPVGRGVGSIDKDSRGSCVAVGTMDPDIEVWDLDKVDSMYPDVILGLGADRADPSMEENVDGEMAESNQSKKKKKKRKCKKANDEFHVDAVLALSANRRHRNLLASGSADKTVKVWDLTTTKCAKSITVHTDKVCALDWHPDNGTSLLTGSYDQTVVVADMRTAVDGSKVPRWAVESDVETVLWNRHDENQFFAATENGILHLFDARMPPSTTSKKAHSNPTTSPSSGIWQLQAHDQAISSLDMNPVIPGYIATGSSDKMVKLWDVQSVGQQSSIQSPPKPGASDTTKASPRPNLVASRNVGVGRVFSTKFGSDPAVAFRLAVAGSKGALQIWDTSTNQSVRRTFATRTSTKDIPTSGNMDKTNDTEGPAKTAADDRIIGLAEDSSDDEDEGGVDPGGNEDGAASMDED